MTSFAPKSLVVRTFAAINLAVYIAWNFVPGSWPFMAKNFLVSGLHLLDGRYWTLLTSVFSQKDFFHLLFNMMVLLSFGPHLETIFGHVRFALFYLGAGIFSSLCHVLSSTYFLGSPELPALGASGALSGVILVFSLLFPKQKILVFGIIPVPALWGALAFIGFDIWGLMAQSHGHGMPIGHGAHLGGALAGIVYFFFWRRALIRRQKEFLQSSFSNTENFPG